MFQESTLVNKSRSTHGPGLYLVPTPLGNLEDITIRALNLLKECDRILCEDTRVTSKLLDHYGISSKLMLYNDAALESTRQKVIKFLNAGEKIALVSDAGMPCISDPGYRLVLACQHAGHPVTALPGPVAFITAAACSGLPTDKIYFHGFMGRKQQDIKNTLQSLESEVTHSFYESPKRLLKTLEFIDEILPNSEIVVVRELSKKFEEKKLGRAKDLLNYYDRHPPKGEIVLLLKRPKDQKSLKDYEQFVEKNLLAGNSVKEIAQKISIDSDSISKKAAYAFIQKIKDDRN